MLGISYIRELFNLSMTDLAKQLGVSKQVISQYEGGKTRISDKRVKQISDMFKIPEKYISKELTDLDKLEMQKAKLNNEIKDYEYEYEDTIIDDETGEEITITRTELDSGALLAIEMNTYQIDEEKLLANIKNTLDQCFEKAQEDEDCMDYGLSDANQLLSLYEYFLDLIKNPNVYNSTLRSVLLGVKVAYGKAVSSDKFVRKIAKAIKNYDEENRKEWQEIADLYEDK
ncbi:XRE family transcriptional regulator [Clostridium carboxidivorans P7]|uniref:Transcriptional regulator, XRE family n=1 Tax=Clostridium carboxidivorans P7 TaxID=536227 RepID=C6PT19_9CLOT|nr:helix-turn-helix transcriptional regulator [Clostridium carboxidivorans]AKN32327.1 XRE family transcriptional regulator [Clostridium carboxidivorans P7]EET87654.1 transcriptional regulator, XRE family [Clostridium carboxidivorans P7]